MAASGPEDETADGRDEGYELHGAGVAVRTDDGSLRSWLDEFLMPGFERMAPAASVPRVLVTSGPEARAASAASRPLGELPCFALDQQVATHPAFESDGVVVVTDEKYGVRYSLEPGAVRVLRDDDAPRSRAAVMRVVRELATAQALADGSGLQLHAAALEHRGRVVVFAGPKEAGKTTLVVRLASLGGLDILGNDRILMTRSRVGSGVSTPWLVRPVPTVVSVRPGTRTQLAGRFDDIPAVPSPAHLTKDELDALTGRLPPHEAGARLKLSPAQFARAAGVQLRGEGRLGHVVLISVDRALDGYSIESCTRERARTGLDATRYGSRLHGRPRTIFEEWLGVTRPPDAEPALLDQLAASVPVSMLRVGPRVLHDDALAAELLERVASGD